MLKTYYPKTKALFFALSLLIIFSSSCSKEKVDSVPTSRDSVVVIPEKHWWVSTYAGSGEKGAANGVDSLATFNFPSYLAIDSSGKIFVSDLQNFLIRKISGGNVSTYTGVGIVNPPLAWGNIYGLAFDQQNNLYDIEYGLVRKITSSTANSIFVGGLWVDYRDGIGTDARFSGINRITTDRQGNFYIPDYDMADNFKIRKVSPTGVVSTIVLKDSTRFSSGSSAGHYYLSPIAVDNDGNIFFTANGNSIIKKADPLGNVTVLAGAGNLGFNNGQGSEATFYTIVALTTDAAGNLFVLEIGNHAVRKVTPSGLVSTIAGLGIPGFKDSEGKSAQFRYPSDIAIDKNGILYVADAGNHRIRKIEYR